MKNFLKSIACCLTMSAPMHAMDKQSDRCGTVIILNGPAAVGKTALVKELQEQSKQVWYYASFDSHFVKPFKKYILIDNARTDIAKLEKSEEDGKPLTYAIFGDSGKQSMLGIFACLAAMAHEGTNVIFDFTCYDSSWPAQLNDRLNGITKYWVAVTLPLEENEKREKERGTTTLGLARAYHQKCHQNIDYDLTLQMDKITRHEAINKINDLLARK